jgi:hypothetical protein
MEDISRELEKEIESYSSPVRNKRKRETRYIAVDDFGKMKSADWIKRAILFLSILSIVLFATTVLFCKFYINYKTEFKKSQEKLALAEKKVKDSIAEQEHLMARLVLSGTVNDKPMLPEAETKNNDKKVIESKVAKVTKRKPKPAAPSPKPVTPAVTPKPIPVKPQVAATPRAPVPVASPAPAQPEIVKNVGIERFQITKEEATGDILVNFRVLNVASEKEKHQDVCLFFSHQVTALLSINWLFPRCLLRTISLPYRGEDSIFP